MQRYKIDSLPEVPSDKEIQQFKNFDAVVRLHKASLLKKLWLKIGAGVAVSTIAIVTILYTSTGTSTVAQLQSTQAELSQKSESEITADKMANAPIQADPSSFAEKEERNEVVSATPETEEIQVKEISNSKENTIVVPEANTEPAHLPKKVVNAKKEQSIVPSKAEEGPAEKVEQPYKMPVFREAEPLEGYTSLYQYLANELKYPAQAVADKISGVVVVSFFINDQGKAENLKIVESLREDCDQEALRLIKQMPLWKPAMADEKPVKTKLSISIRFNLQP
ncbi:MAG: energy transducer TonB [Rufibacter sp.]